MKKLKQIVQRLGASDSPDSYRQTFVNKEIGNVEAELIEKSLREHLEKYLSQQLQEKIVFALNLNSLESQGVVEVMVGGTINRKVLKAVTKAFSEVLSRSDQLAVRQAKPKVSPVYAGDDLSALDTAI